MNLLSLSLSVLTVFIILCISELGWRKQWLSNEIGRKFVHITVGTFVAFWPFFLSWNQIRFLSLAFIVVVVLAKYFRIFRAISSVQRPTYGELFFAITVGLLTFITHTKGVYAAAILQMSLADGFAAIIGTQYGQTNTYRLLGHVKSVAGTSAFFITSLLILIGYALFGTLGLPIGIIIFGAFTAAALENLGAFGFDNVLVPVFVGLLLTRL